MDIVYLMILMVGLAVVGLVVMGFVNYKNEQAREQAIRDSICVGEWIYYKDFEDNWIVAKDGRHGIAGYKYNDTPGCYVITVYNTSSPQDWMAYENVYVGQSVNICQRVHSHFTGKGKGDIYADIKYGKHVFVRMIPCDRGEMNDREKELIDILGARLSYNATNGGGIRWR